MVGQFVGCDRTQDSQITVKIPSLHHTLLYLSLLLQFDPSAQSGQGSFTPFVKR